MYHVKLERMQSRNKIVLAAYGSLERPETNFVMITLIDFSFGVKRSHGNIFVCDPELSTEEFPEMRPMTLGQ